MNYIKALLQSGDVVSMIPEVSLNLIFFHRLCLPIGQ